jgi:hypothetical protein
VKQQLSGFRILYSWPALLQVSGGARAAGARPIGRRTLVQSQTATGGWWATRGTAVQTDVVALGCDELVGERAAVACVVRVAGRWHGGPSWGAPMEHACVMQRPGGDGCELLGLRRVAVEMRWKTRGRACRLCRHSIDRQAGRPFLGCPLPPSRSFPVDVCGSYPASASLAGR